VRGIVIDALRRRKWRTALCCLGIAIAVGTFTTISGLARGYIATWERAHEEFGSDIVGFEAGLVELMSSRLAQSVVEEIDAVPGVSQASGVLFRVLTMAETEGRLTVSGVTEDSFIWRSVPLVAGGMPPVGLSPPGMVVGDRGAAAFGIAVGDQVTILGRPVRVTGLAGFEGALNAFSGMMRLEDMQALLNRDSSITYVAVAVASGGSAAVASVRDRLERTFDEIAFTPGETSAREQRVNQMILVVARVISLFSLAIGFLVIVNTMAMTIGERAPELALLSAVGWSRVRIVQLLSLEISVLMIVGLLAGVAGGVSMVRLLSLVPEVAPFLDPQPSWIADGASAVAIAFAGGVVGLLPAVRTVLRPPVDLLARE